MLKIVSLSFMLLLTSLSVSADNYYQVQLDVPDRSAKSRTQILRDAFNQVLVKVTGTRKILETSRFKKISFADIQANLDSYSYQQQGQQTQIQYQFHPAFIKKVLNTAKTAIWTKNRPQVLAWILIETTETQIIGESNYQYRPILQQQAQQRGLSLLFPLLDLEDMQAITTAQIQTADRQKLIIASKRYRPNVIVNANIQNKNGKYTGTWHIYIGQEDITWKKTYDDLKVLLQDSVDIITDTLASRYNTTANQKSQVQNVVIHGIKNLDDYATLQIFLQQRSEFSHIQIEQAQADQLILKIEAAGGQSGIATALRAGGLLVLTAPVNDERLHYQWQR